MKDKLKKLDWAQIGVVALGVVATVARSIYETKRFNSELDKKYDNNVEKRINEIIDKRLSDKLGGNK